MSLELPVGNDFSGFTQRTSGDGVITINNGKASLSGGVGTGVAVLEKRVATRPGEVWELSCLARRLSGADGASGALFIDWQQAGSNRNLNEVVSEHWQEYSTRWAIPFGGSDTQYINLGVGVYTSVGGQIEVASPRASVSQTPFGVSRTVASGLIEWTGSAAVVRDSRASSGISAVSWDAATDTLKVTIPTLGATATDRTGPNVFVSMAASGAAAAAPLVAKAGTYDIATGEVDVRFYNTSTNAYQDIDALGAQFFFFFKAEI